MIVQLLGLLLAHLLLTGLPGAAAALLAARRGVDSIPLLLALALLVSGLVALLAFWAYYGGRTLGESFSYFAVFASAAAVVWTLATGVDRGLLRQLAVPAALWALASAFLVFFGFLHGGIDDSLAMAASRFYGPLPSDNLIPAYFADWFFAHGHSGHPVLAPGWLASDRPPLQTGYVLSQRLFGLESQARDYQVLGVVLQQLWVVGLWALLVAARLGRLTRALVTVAVLTSGVAIVNGFYVWPKLLPTALLLAAAALVLTPLWEEVRRRAWGAALLAALLALSILAHGGSVFGAVPLAVVAAFRGLPGWRWIATAALAFLLLALPWSAYQRFGEPPGNRLIKYQLAGFTGIDDRGSLATIVDAYEAAGLGGALHNKGQNLVTIFGGGPWLDHVRTAVDDLTAGDPAGFLREIRTDLFYNLVPSLGLFLLAPFAMLVWRRRGPPHGAEWSLALRCFWVLAVGIVFWALAMFGNDASRTVMHQGSFLLPVLGICGCVCGLRATVPRFAAWCVAATAVAMLAIYTPALDPLPGTSYSVAAALLAALALAGFCLVLARFSDAPEAGPEPAAAAR